MTKDSAQIHRGTPPSATAFRVNLSSRRDLTSSRLVRAAVGVFAASLAAGALAAVGTSTASATDTGPGGPAGASSVSTKCFHVGIVNGHPQLKGNSRHVTKADLVPDDKGFGWVDTAFSYGLRLKGTVYKKPIWNSTDYYWYFVPERLAIGGNGTLGGGGKTVAKSAANPAGQALGSQTAFRLQSSKTGYGFGVGAPWGASLSWENSQHTARYGNATWNNTGTSKASGEMNWAAPLAAYASRASGLSRITVQSAVLTGGNGPAYWTKSVGWDKPDFYRSPLNGSANFAGLMGVPCSSVNWTLAGDRDVENKPDTTNPLLPKPVASLSPATSRVAGFQLAATDNQAVTQMRVRGSWETTWRPWIDYAAAGTMTLPDRYGTFTLWFQVRDAAGNLSEQRAVNVTRIQDLNGPVLTGSVSKGDPAGRIVSYALGATDDYSAVTQMRVLISGEDWRPWVPFSPTGTVVLPDGYGRFGVSFQVMDAAGNLSAPLFAGAVTRTAPVALTLRQIDNLGNLRSCGSSEATACSDVVKKFRTTIDSPIVPNTNLLLKAWRNVNGSWVETSTSPFMSEAIASRRTVDMTVTANLLAGVWRFQAQVPRDGDVSEFAASDYQYLRIG